VGNLNQDSKAMNDQPLTHTAMLQPTQPNELGLIPGDGLEAVPAPPVVTAIVFDIDGVVRDVAGSYLRALADTVEHFTQGAYRPSLAEVDILKAEGLWNNDWEAAQELIYRFFEAQGQPRSTVALNYPTLVDFFQERYRGRDWNGYIREEPLLMGRDYLAGLTTYGIPWGFFSGATRASATYVLETRLGLEPPILVAMEDAPGKPDPTGLLVVVEQLTVSFALPGAAPVIYVGDTVADLQTVQRARTLQPARAWLGIGIVPPHVQDRAAYAGQLKAAGATQVCDRVEELSPQRIVNLVAAHSKLTPK
jgi:HAD superfamily phosphatase